MPARVSEPREVSGGVGFEASHERKNDLQQPTFALTADVSDAHRQVHPSDWKYLGCRVEKGGAAHVNTVGTFGISSASYHWSMVAAAVGHLAQYLAGHSSATWHMLVADDFHLEAGGQDSRFALISFSSYAQSQGYRYRGHRRRGETQFLGSDSRCCTVQGS